LQPKASRHPSEVEFLSFDFQYNLANPENFHRQKGLLLSRKADVNLLELVVPQVPERNAYMNLRRLLDRDPTGEFVCRPRQRPARSDPRDSNDNQRATRSMGGFSTD